MHNFRELKIWNRAIELVVDIYKITSGFPEAEKFGLTNQMRRAAVSISSNIAEGCGRNSDKELVRFLSISQGSSNELETQVMIASRLNFISKEAADAIISELNENQKMTRKFIDSLKSNV